MMPSDICVTATNWGCTSMLRKQIHTGWLVVAKHTYTLR